MHMWMNSRFIKEGDYFLVDKSNLKYVNEAIDKGAAKIITELDENYDVETIKVKSMKKYLNENYKNAIEGLTLIGITGTNGKTTTCYLIYQMLNFLGVKTAYLGTIGFYLDDVLIAVMDYKIHYEYKIKNKDWYSLTIIFMTWEFNSREDPCHGM